MNLTTQQITALRASVTPGAWRTATFKGKLISIRAWRRLHVRGFTDANFMITQSGRAALFAAVVRDAPRRAPLSAMALLGHVPTDASARVAVNEKLPEAIREGELPTLIYVCPGCTRAWGPGFVVPRTREIDGDRICVDCERTMVRYQHAEAP